MEQQKKKAKIKIRRYITLEEVNNALVSLKGILLGISLDNVINDDEIDGLLKWANDNYHLIEYNPFWEIKQTIRAATIDIENRATSIKRLIAVCEKHQTGSSMYNQFQTELRSLRGMCKGIMSDGIINDKEIFELEKWLKKHTHLESFYPYDEIRNLIFAALEDGRIDEDERTLLKKYFADFADFSNKTEALTPETFKNDLDCLFLKTEIPKLKNKVFVIININTEKHINKIKKAISSLGGKYSNSLNDQTDYLLFGEEIQNNTILEKAIRMRRGGHPICIIKEADFWTVVEK